MSEQDANAFVAKMKKLLDGVPREHTEQYVLALAAADLNYDGIISGDELAAAMVKLNEATAPKRIEEWKTGCSHPPIMEKMATNLQWHAAHTLHVLNNDGVDD